MKVARVVVRRRTEKKLVPPFDDDDGNGDGDGENVL